MERNLLHGYDAKTKKYLRSLLKELKTRYAC